MKHYIRQRKNAKENNEKDQNKPGSSHPYTQRQLVLERKTRVDLPSSRQFTPKHFVKTGYNFSKTQGYAFLCQFRGSEKTVNFNLSIKQSRFKFTKTKYRSTSQHKINIYCTEHTSISQGLGLIHIKVGLRSFLIKELRLSKGCIGAQFNTGQVSLRKNQGCCCLSVVLLQMPWSFDIAILDFFTLFSSLIFFFKLDFLFTLSLKLSVTQEVNFALLCTRRESQPLLDQLTQAPHMGTTQILLPGTTLTFNPRLGLKKEISIHIRFQGVTNGLSFSKQLWRP